MLPVAVLAGGLGTRVRHRTGPAVPKALLVVGGSPFIDLKLRELRAGGASRGSSCSSATAGRRSSTTSGTARRFDLEVEYVRDPPDLLGTGGAIRHALPGPG